MERQEFSYPDAPREEMIGLIPADATHVLDVGCARGAFGAALRRTRPGVVVHGIEPVAAAVQTARERLDQVFFGRFPDALPDASGAAEYDCVVFNDVLEHVSEPAPLIAAALRILRPEGTIVASIPNVRYGPVVWDLAVRGRWDYGNQGVLDRTHVRFYTRRSIQGLILQMNCTISEFTRLNVPGSRRAPLLARGLEIGFRDFSCPQFAFVAHANA